MKELTLKDISEQNGIPITSLRLSIRRGELKAKKSGRNYIIKMADFEAFTEYRNRPPEPRRYNCSEYIECLNKAAMANADMTCKGCRRFRLTESCNYFIQQ